MKTFKVLLTVTMVALLFSQCKYDFIVPEEVIDPNDPTIEVSFSEDIQPIFTDNNCTACHDTGGQIPDLTEGNAYSAINTSRYIDKDNPDQSLIYTKPHPSGSHPVKYSESDAARVLAWITQGAENN